MVHRKEQPQRQYDSGALRRQRRSVLVRKYENTKTTKWALNEKGEPAHPHPLLEAIPCTSRCHGTAAVAGLGESEPGCRVETVGALRR